MAYLKNEQIPFDLNLLKVDKDNTETPLKGAEFKLNKLIYDFDTSTISYEEGTEKTVTTGNDGKAKFEGLALGFYEINETKAPAGYILAENNSFYIKVASSGVSLVQRTDGKPMEDWETISSDGNVTFANSTATITNEPGSELPMTGGPGIIGYRLVGAIVLLAAGVLLFRKKDN